MIKNEKLAIAIKAVGAVLGLIAIGMLFCASAMVENGNPETVKALFGIGGALAGAFILSQAV